MSVIEELIAEAKRQRRNSPPPAYLSFVDKALWHLGWLDGWYVLMGEVAKRRPFRWAWQAKCAALLYTKWNAPKGHEARSSIRQQWSYAGTLAEMLDEAGEGYLSPSDAIDEDRQYWDE
jgi:hypothetical protein